MTHNESVESNELEWCTSIIVMAVVMHVPIIWKKSVVLNLLPLPVFIHCEYNKPQILKREIDVENSF